jgi:HK97 family phage portal protein
VREKTIARIAEQVQASMRQPANVETRDPTAGSAIVRTRYYSPGSYQISSWDAEWAIREQYIANTYVYRCVQAIANAVAGCAFRAGLDPEKASEYRTDAPLAKLLGPPPGGPNPVLTPRRLWAWTVAQYLVTGRWAWEIEGRPTIRSSNDTVGLWPLPSSLIDPIPVEGGRQYFQGYYFAKSDPAKRRKLTLDQVLYDWKPAQNDVRQAESVLQAARLDVNIAVMQDRYDHAFLKNDARPAAIVVHEEFAEPNEREAFRRQFKDDHQGVDNAGKTIFLEATPGDEEVNKTFHIERLGLSQKDAEFIPRMEAKIRAICIAFGTPLSILGDSSSRTFDNAGQEYENWWEGTILPLMHELEDAVNLHLAPRLGREIGWFDTSKVKALQKDSKIYMLGADAMGAVEKRLITPNEWREAWDMDEMDGGDELVEPPAPPQPVEEDEEEEDEPEGDIEQNEPADPRKQQRGAKVEVLSDKDGIVVLRRVV